MEYDGFRAVNKPGKCNISMQGGEKDSCDRKSSCKEEQVASKGFNHSQGKFTAIVLMDKTMEIKIRATTFNDFSTVCTIKCECTKTE